MPRLPSLTRMRSAVRSRLLLGTLLLAGMPIGQAGAGPPAPLPMPAPLLPPTPAPEPGISGFPPCLPPVRVRDPRPADGPTSVPAFLESVTANDAVLEILVGQGRILTTRIDLSVPGKTPALVAVGDPTVIDFVILSRRQVRVVGLRLGVTDLSITTPDNHTYSFEVRVVADLPNLRHQLACMFPDASLRLAQFRDHLVVEGQARDNAQVTRILETIRAYLLSVQIGQARRVTGPQPGGPAPPPMGPPGEPGADTPGEPPAEGEQPATPGAGAQTGPQSSQSFIAPPQIINLLTVPGPRQVLLKVRVAELNRTAFRQIGADLLGYPGGDAILGTNIGGSPLTASATASEGILEGFAELLNGTNTTAFAIFDRGRFSIFLNALRRNNLLKILAEPNLVALDGHAANFLAGGEFPIPVPQNAGAGVATTVTVQFREFGVRLGFLPLVLDGESIRLTVDPEVSNIDRSLSTTLVVGGSPVPGLNTRKAHTVVEMREGQTLAIAGLMQISLAGGVARVPLLGDLPVLGPFFSNNTGERIEKELIVLVTPYLIEPMHPGQVPPSPGDEVKEPNDLEFYLLGRIEGRTGRDARSTTNYEFTLERVRRLLRLDDNNVCGPHGFSD